MTHYQLERNYGCRVSDAWTFRGLKTAILENEAIRIVILIDKGADIYQFVHKPSDIDFMWRDPHGVRNPRTFTPSTGNPVGTWMDYYEGGWQTVFPGGGFPSEYQGADMGLHAEANIAPWDAAIVEDTPERASIRCWIRTARAPYFFEKTLTLTSGSPVLSVDQTLTNEGEEVGHCVWGEHIALGPPFLSPDCVIDLPGGTLINHPEQHHPNATLKLGGRTAWPMTEDQRGNPVDLSQIPPKESRRYDMSYVADMPEGWYAVTNQERGVGFGVRWPTDVYKFLWYWQAFGGGFGYPFWGRTYNVGLEPFSSWTNQGIADAKANGTVMTLQPGESVSTALKVVAYTGSDRVQRITEDGEVIRRAAGE